MDYKYTIALLVDAEYKKDSIKYLLLNLEKAGARFISKPFSGGIPEKNYNASELLAFIGSEKYFCGLVIKEHKCYFNVHNQQGKIHIFLYSFYISAMKKYITQPTEQDECDDESMIVRHSMDVDIDFYVRFLLNATADSPIISLNVEKRE